MKKRGPDPIDELTQRANDGVARFLSGEPTAEVDPRVGEWLFGSDHTIDGVLLDKAGTGPTRMLVEFAVARWHAGLKRRVACGPSLSEEFCRAIPRLVELANSGRSLRRSREAKKAVESLSAEEREFAFWVVLNVDGQRLHQAISVWREG